VQLLVAVGAVRRLRFRSERGAVVASPAGKVDSMLATPAAWTRWPVGNRRGARLAPL
jgi:hypothetical protein